MRTFATLIFTLAIPLVLTGCDHVDQSPDHNIDAGYSALNTDRPSEALAYFESAIAQLKQEDTRYSGAKLGAVRARCYEDPQVARDEFLALSASPSIQARDYNLVVTDLLAVASRQAAGSKPPEAGETTEPDAESKGWFEAQDTIECAIALLEDGKLRHPDYPKWGAWIQRVGDKASTLGYPDAAGALADLGYLGGDSPSDSPKASQK